MAGHSKWANIKHKKAAQDAKRGKVFTKIIKELMVSAKSGGSDPEANPRLRQAISSAKAANMPNDTMKRAVQKGAGELEGVDYEETTYEAFGPGGVAIILDVMTDNKNRTVAEIRHLMTKYGGALGENGSVSWMFEKLGQVTISANGHDENKVFEEALEAGADDFILSDNVFIITAKPTNTVDVSDKLIEKGYNVISSEIEMVPKNTLNVKGNDIKKLINLIEHLEEHDDIQNIYSNFEVDDAEI